MDLTTYPHLHHMMVQDHQAALRAERAHERLARAARTPSLPTTVADLHVLPMAELVRLCTQETARYHKGTPNKESFGLELFRRAIVERDDAAWTAVYAQYENLVRYWQSAGGGSNEDAVVVTFALFWRAMNPAKFACFSSLATVLRYLKRCARTAVVRVASAPRREEPLDDVAVAVLPAAEDVEDIVLERVEAPAFWHLVRTFCSDEREQAVLYLACVRELSPRQIQQAYSIQFPSIREIYQLKRNGLTRLRRRPELRAWLRESNRP